MMKPYLWFVLLCLASTPVLADPPQKAKTVLSFATELNLSADQRKKLVDLLGGLRTQLVAGQERSVTLQRELNALLRSNAPLPQIRQKFEEIAKNEVDGKMADVSTARRVQEVLTTDQFEKWKAIQIKSRAGL